MTFLLFLAITTTACAGGRPASTEDNDAVDAREATPPLTTSEDAMISTFKTRATSETFTVPGPEFYDVDGRPLSGRVHTMDAEEAPPIEIDRRETLKYPAQLDSLTFHLFGVSSTSIGPPKVYLDMDGDGWGSGQGFYDDPCPRVYSGYWCPYVTNAGDCDDTDPKIGNECFTAPPPAKAE